MKPLPHIALLLLSAALWLGQAAAEPLAVTARPVFLDPAAPARTRLGRLAWRGGIEIASPDPRFGGLSGLLVSADGTRLTAVTDEGHWIVARLTYDASGRLVGLSDGAIGPLHGPEGGHLTRKRDQDAESLARLPDGSVVVGFERRHRLWRYPPSTNPLAGHPAPLAAPSELISLRSNSGIEALAVLPDGALLALAEGRKEANESPAFLWRDGVWSSLRYPHRDGFRPAGAARLPNGDILVIERRYTVVQGVAVGLRRVPAGAIAPGAPLDGAEIAVLRPPLTVDNFEGVAARESATGETLVYLVSDDNFNALQRTLLLLFALK